MDISSWTGLRVFGVSLAWAIVTFGIRWFQIWSAERRLRPELLSWGSPYSTVLVPPSVRWLLLLVVPPVLLVATWLIVNPTSDESTYQDVLLENLAIAPSRYHNKRIRVVGVCQLQFEGTVLWLNDEARTDGRLDKAIWLNVGWPPSRVIKVRSGQHVVVEARFDATDHGHMGCCKGALDSIERIVQLTPGQERDQRRRAMDNF